MENKQILSIKNGLNKTLMSKISDQTDFFLRSNLLLKKAFGDSENSALFFEWTILSIDNILYIPIVLDKNLIDTYAEVNEATKKLLIKNNYSVTASGNISCNFSFGIKVLYNDELKSYYIKEFVPLNKDSLDFDFTFLGANLNNSSNTTILSLLNEESELSKSAISSYLFSTVFSKLLYVDEIIDLEFVPISATSPTVLKSVLQVLKNLQDGVRFALDDFSTNYSTRNIVKNVELDLAENEISLAEVENEILRLTHNIEKDFEKLEHLLQSSDLVGLGQDKSDFAKYVNYLKYEKLSILDTISKTYLVTIKTAPQVDINDLHVRFCDRIINCLMEIDKILLNIGKTVYQTYKMIA